ncbi:MAG: hypothetical protein ACM3IJ_01970 [Candidatus Levyibacteriota bacterium]
MKNECNKPYISTDASLDYEVKKPVILQQALLNQLTELLPEETIPINTEFELRLIRQTAGISKKGRFLLREERASGLSRTKYVVLHESLGQEFIRGITVKNGEITESKGVNRYQPAQVEEFLSCFAADLRQAKPLKLKYELT